MYAFKKPRSQSLLKHTGIYYTAEDEKSGEVEIWIHEVTGGQDGNLLRSQLVKRKKEEHELFEDTFCFATFQKSQVDDFEALFLYPYDYHLLFNNCRDQCIFFIRRIEAQGVTVVVGVFDWVQNIKRNDVLVGAALVGTALYGAYALYKAFTAPQQTSIENSEEEDSDGSPRQAQSANQLQYQD